MHNEPDDENVHRKLGAHYVSDFILTRWTTLYEVVISVNKLRHINAFIDI